MAGLNAPIQPYKRIAMFLDGTWNTINDNTNVWRLRALTAPVDTDGVRQLIYYDQGLGTEVGSKARGGMFGVGIDNKILQAYRWLIENFNNGDKIYIFGFSRGAYTARSLSGMISRCGILQPGGPLSIKQLYDRYKKALNVPSLESLKANPPSDPTLEEEWLIKYSRFTTIQFLGVYDTVGSLGFPSSYSRFKLQHGFLNTHLRAPNISAFHALAIDEHRKDFSPTLWTRTTPNDPSAPAPRPPRTLAETEQRWFAGAHGNIGGGYSDDILAQRPFAWMASKATGQGLVFKDDVKPFVTSRISPVIDSYTDFLSGWYRLIADPFYREIDAAPINKSDGIETTINETIDNSVFERWRNDRNYRPVNLAKWAAKHSIDPGIQQNSVLARTPSSVAPD